MLIRDRLSEALLNPRKNGFFKVSEEKLEKAEKCCEGYKAFRDSAKTCLLYTSRCV